MSDRSKVRPRKARAGPASAGGTESPATPRAASQDKEDAPALEVAHVLFMDIVGYSKLLFDEQTKYLGRLQEIVRATKEFRLGQGRDELICLPTGDGMALVFFGDPEAPL